MAPSEVDAKSSLKTILARHPELVQFLDENGKTITGRTPSEPEPPTLKLPPYSEADAELGKHLCEVDFASIERRVMESLGG